MKQEKKGRAEIFDFGKSARVAGVGSVKRGLKQAVKKMTVPEEDAFWISPSGKLIPVKRTHIQTIIDFPEAFGSTGDSIKKKYAEHGEPLNFEGKARQKIMEALINEGWIRIRYQRGIDTYSIELDRLNKKNKDYLWAWAQGTAEYKDKKWSGVIITEFKHDYMSRESTVSEIAKEALYNALDTGARKTLIILDSVHQFFEISPVARQRQV